MPRDTIPRPRGIYSVKFALYKHACLGPGQKLGISRVDKIMKSTFQAGLSHEEAYTPASSSLLWSCIQLECMPIQHVHKSCVEVADVPSAQDLPLRTCDVTTQLRAMHVTSCSRINRLQEPIAAIHISVMDTSICRLRPPNGRRSRTHQGN
jgi:hypothetical protein